VLAAPSRGARALVISGGEKAFSGGLDVPYLMGLDRAGLKRCWSRFFGAARALAGSPIPTAAAIAGHNPAGGCVLALCCDYRVMASGAYRIGLNETQVGLAVPVGVMRLMQRVVGQYRAERLLVSGEMVDAERAFEIGLVDELVDIDHVPLRARVWLEDLLKLPRKPMLATRATAREDLIAAMRPEGIQLDRFVDAWQEPDTQAALRALVAKLGK